MFLKIRRGENIYMKQEVKFLMKNKLLMSLVAFTFVFMFSSGVFAYYFLSHQSTITLDVSGGVSSFSVTQDLGAIIIDVSSGLNNTQALVLENANGGIQLNYNLTTDIINSDPSNCDNSNDLIFELRHEGSIVDQNFTMNPGTNNFEFITTVLNDRACPQQGNVTIDLFE